MQVILKADVDHLGYAQDVVDVKRGYWRNYLRPRGLAETVTPGRLAEMTARTERLRAAEARNAEEAAELKALLDRTVITIPAHAGPQGKLFGSVTATDIARAVDSTRKLRLDHRKVKLVEPIRALGTFMVPVEIYTGVTAEVQTMVVEAVATGEEIAALQAAADQAEADAIAAVEAAEKAADAAAAAAAAPAVEEAAEDADAAPAEDAATVPAES